MESVKWIFKLDKDERHDCGKTFDRDYAFVDSDGRRWLEISRDGILTVKAEYAWDGCTPKFVFLDIVLGTPDGVPNEHTCKPKTYYASLFHDVLYQFYDDGLPLSLKEADEIFLKLMTRDNFKLRWFYYFVVRVFGRWYRKFTSWKREWNGSEVKI